MEFRHIVRSGIPALDDVVQGLRLGDNVVWQVDNLEDYSYFVKPFAQQAVRDGRRCIYFRFAPHPPVLGPDSGFEIIEVDPSPGFDPFSGEVHRIIEERGKEAFYVFDNLSALVVEWATDELLANFFQVTCPFLFELDTVTYFALTRGKHAHSAVARIRDTTQLLIDVYHVKDQMYIHPVKVWDRYTPQMFLPHQVSGASWSPVFQSGDAAAVSSVARESPLRTTAEAIAPWESVYERLTRYRETGMVFSETAPEIAALKQELARMMIGNHPQFNLLVDKYFSVDDLLGIRNRLIGSGRIGGKAAGMLAARRVIAEAKGDVDFTRVLESHDSFYIGSDVFFTFLVKNDLFRLRLQLSRSSSISHEEFDEVEKRFLAGNFPPEIIEQFRNLLDYFGQAPIIVRSSSLLEDSFGNAFAGKYRSEFCANQGSPDERLEAFLRAVKLVYASALNPDALSYRRRRGLGESDEQMAILVMRVSGMPYKQYFFPSLAGVAFSRNLYAWSDRIDPEAGRDPAGVRTRHARGQPRRRRLPAHDRGEPPDAPSRGRRENREIFPAGNGRARPEGQRARHRAGLRRARRRGLPEPAPACFDHEGGSPVRPLQPQHRRAGVEPRADLQQPDRPDGFRNDSRANADRPWNRPTATPWTPSSPRTWTSRGHVRINLLQCRPLWLPGSSGPVSIPADIPEDRMLFKSDRFISGGEVGNVRFILYIDPRWYAAIPDAETKKTLGRLVGRINNLPQIEESKVLMIGPGRWGTSNIDLGINVGYADIDNASVLVELAREEAGHVPEVSYGTHFFQDLVEQQIIYLPVYPDDEGCAFNEAFFQKSPNCLKELLPDAGKFEGIVKMIDVPAAAGGAHARVIADPESRRAVCFLE